MAGYRKIPIAQNIISPLANNENSIAIPWDYNNPSEGNIYITPDPEAETQFIVGSDANVGDHVRTKSFTIRTVFPSSMVGQVSEAELIIGQLPSVFEYRLELFTQGQYPVGEQLATVTPWFSESTNPPILNNNNNKGPQGYDDITYHKGIFYCEYRNGVRTRAYNLNPDGSGLDIEIPVDWVICTLQTLGTNPYAALHTQLASRGIEEGDARETTGKLSYNPLADAHFDWDKGEIQEDFPAVDLSFIVQQDANRVVDYIIDQWAVQKNNAYYWPNDYLPAAKGDGYDNYLNVILEYRAVYGSGSKKSLEGIGDSNITIEKDGPWGDYSRLQINRNTQKVYYVEDNNTADTINFTIKAVIDGDYLQNGPVESSEITLIQAPNDHLIKAHYGTGQVVALYGGSQDSAFLDTNFPSTYQVDQEIDITNNVGPGISNMTLSIYALYQGNRLLLFEGNNSETMSSGDSWELENTLTNTWNLSATDITISQIYVEFKVNSSISTPRMVDLDIDINGNAHEVTVIDTLVNSGSREYTLTGTYNLSNPMHTIKGNNFTLGVTGNITR